MSMPDASPPAEVAPADASASTKWSPLWFAAQVVPSPEIVRGAGVTRFGLRWQLTPVLYSFGVHRTANPWRAFVVEPFLRQSGSVELFVSPEYLFYGRSFSDGLLWRIGARSYFPLVEYGDYLSISVGASYFEFAGHGGVAYEGGAYLLFGIVGAQLTWSPSGGPAAAIATLRLRYF
jgi:hypothetical protein